LLRNRLQANEATAIECLRVIASAQISHNSAKNSFADFATLTSEQDGSGTSFLDTSWAEGVRKNGYVYSMASADTTNFVCYADPVQPGITGNRFFRVDSSGIVRYSTAGQPDANATPIGAAS
jgi:hypothetical protein